MPPPPASVVPVVDPEVRIRPYRSPGDAAPTLATFEAAIRQTAAAFYSPEQIEAWVGPPSSDPDTWDECRRGSSTLVATIDTVLAGFTDLLPDGLINMLFVDPRFARRGVARALLSQVKAQARSRGIAELRSLASRSAQPVFECMGFVVVADRPHNTVRGVVIPNAEVRCRIDDTN